MQASRNRRSRSWPLLALVLGLHAVPLHAEPQFDTLRIIAPAAPGGGWDQTARAMQLALQHAGIVRVVPVENVAGAAGTIGLARFIGAERGNAEAVMVSGLIMLAAIITHASPVSLREVTPIARLTGEYEVLVVPAASPYRTLQDFVAAFTARPESISWGGGSAGGTDQIVAGLIADAVGVAPARVNYIAFSGGGEMLASLLGGQVSAGINGLQEMAAQLDAGTLRVLGISSPERLPGVAAATFREQGVDVELVNWRSLVAAPGISAVERRRLTLAAETMARSAEWRELLQRYHWLDLFLTGRDFDQFVIEQDTQVRAILRKFGAGSPTSAGRAVATGYPALVFAGLLLTGTAALIDLRRKPGGHRTAPAPRRWRTAVVMATGMVLNVILLESAGFVIAASVLFWFSARAFDDRRPARDAAFALTISVASYALFVHVLKLSLPAGVLAGWL